MTNKEYMFSLSNKELAVYLRSTPWAEKANENWLNGWSSYDEGITQWLEEESENNCYGQ